MTITRCSIRTKNQFTNLYLKNSHHSLTLRTNKKLHKRKKNPPSSNFTTILQISKLFFTTKQTQHFNNSAKQTNKQNYLKKKKKRTCFFWRAKFQILQHIFSNLVFLSWGLLVAEAYHTPRHHHQF